MSAISSAVVPTARSVNRGHRARSSRLRLGQSRHRARSSPRRGQRRSNTSRSRSRSARRSSVRDARGFFYCSRRVTWRRPRRAVRASGASAGAAGRRLAARQKTTESVEADDAPSAANRASAALNSSRPAAAGRSAAAMRASRISRPPGTRPRRSIAPARRAGAAGAGAPPAQDFRPDPLTPRHSERHCPVLPRRWRRRRGPRAAYSARRVCRGRAPTASVKATASAAVSGTRRFISSAKLRWGIAKWGARSVPVGITIGSPNEPDTTGVSLDRGGLGRAAAAEPSGADPESPLFHHGVASGDPLGRPRDPLDAAHATADPGAIGPVDVEWEVAARRPVSPAWSDAARHRPRPSATTR